MQDSEVNITWTEHAQERQKQWEKKLGITCEEVENSVLHPQQVVRGDRDALVAQIKRGNGLLRVPFVKIGNKRQILTLYWTSKIGRYWEEESNADSI